MSFHRSGWVRQFAVRGGKEVTEWISSKGNMITDLNGLIRDLPSRFHVSMTGEERYQFLQSQNPDLFNQVPLKYLASMMGMTPESLSRIRKDLTQGGVGGPRGLGGEWRDPGGREGSGG